MNINNILHLYISLFDLLSFYIVSYTSLYNKSNLIQFYHTIFDIQDNKETTLVKLLLSNCNCDVWTMSKQAWGSDIRMGIHKSLEVGVYLSALIEYPTEFVSEVTKYFFWRPRWISSNKLHLFWKLTIIENYQQTDEHRSMFNFMLL